MSIPLINDVNKNDINTSIIAIKKDLERINTLLGLNNTEEIDTSVFATKAELEQAKTDLAPVDTVTSGNMHSVTSNAVAKAMSYSTSEINTGAKWIDGRDIYKLVLTGDWTSDNQLQVPFNKSDYNIDIIFKMECLLRSNNGSYYLPAYWYSSSDMFRWYYYVDGNVITMDKGTYPILPINYYFVIKYVKRNN